jgi:uncharacterized Zn finger protein (UPF0148 family)
MAVAMGLSYWDISQLRIGFRRMKALDERFLAACATFLDVPALTIAMLAGQLDPREALASHALTGTDIVHARHLLATEPAEMELVTPPNPGRPLQGLGVEELAELHRAYGVNPAVQEALRAELRYRPPSKTELLRAAVDGRSREDVVPQEVKPAPGIMRCVSCQTRLRIPHLSEPGEIRCPACGTEYAVHWEAAVCVVQRQVPIEDEEARAEEDVTCGAPEMTEAQAWVILGLPEGSPRDAMDRARRALLQQYHPDRLGHLPPLLQKLAEDAFKRVNDACELLRSRR